MRKGLPMTKKELVEEITKKLQKVENIDFLKSMLMIVCNFAKE